MGTVAETADWTGWVSSELEDLLDVGGCALESCEVSVDLMETIGMTVLLERGRSAHSRVEHALRMLVSAAVAWQDAVEAVQAIDPAGTDGAGPAAPAGATGTAVRRGPEEPQAPAGTAGPAGGAGDAGPTVPAPATGASGSPAGVGAPVAGQVAAVDRPGAAPGEQDRPAVPGTAPAPGADPAGPGSAGPAGVSGPGAGSRWDRWRDRVPFHGAPVHGTLREWGFTQRSWKSAPGRGCELSLVPAAGHVPYSDPVNDVFWVSATDDRGTVVEGHPLHSTRDRLGGHERYTEPSTRQALRELVEDRGLPSALSAGTRYGAGASMAAATGIVAADGGHTAATVLSSGTGAVAGGIGLSTAWAARTVVARRRGRIRDPSAPRTVRFTRPLEEMKNLRIRVRRGDHPRHAREAARTRTLALLEHHAHRHGVPEPVLRRARDKIQSLPRFPRDEERQFRPGDCQRATLMHVPEGRERLVRDLLGIDDHDRKR